MNKITTHRHAAGGRMSPTYQSWTHMKDRCTNPNFNHYHRYGGRGISFDPLWVTFEAFLADMGERPAGTTLDRRDNDGMYCKDNCQWATRGQQANNRSSNRMVTLGGDTRNLTQWASHYGINRDVVKRREARGWSVKRSLTTPQMPSGRPRSLMPSVGSVA